MAVTPLGAYIEHVRREFEDQNGGARLSYDAIARRGGDVRSGGRLHQLATSEIKAMPQPSTLAVLADGLPADLWYVTLLAMQSAGFYVPEHLRPQLPAGASWEAPTPLATVTRFRRGRRDPRPTELSDADATVPDVARQGSDETQDPEST